MRVQLSIRTCESALRVICSSLKVAIFQPEASESVPRALLPYSSTCDFPTGAAKVLSYQEVAIFQPELLKRVLKSGDFSGAVLRVRLSYLRVGLFVSTSTTPISRAPIFPDGRLFDRQAVAGPPPSKSNAFLSASHPFFCA